MPAPPGVLVGPVSRNLNLILSYPGRYGPVALPHRPEILGMGPQQLLYPRRTRVRRRVRVLPVDPAQVRFRRGVRIRAAEQRPPHGSTNQVELVPGLPNVTPRRERGAGTSSFFMSAITMLRF